MSTRTDCLVALLDHHGHFSQHGNAQVGRTTFSAERKPHCVFKGAWRRDKETAKLEKEGNKTIWSVDVKMPVSKNITEVHIEADTGKVVSITVETPEQQAAEAAADKKKSTAH